MKTLNIEGFKIVTDIDEAAPYCRMYDESDISSIEGELTGKVIPVIEEMIIGGKTAASFFYDNCRGYKDRRLEPFNWRENKSMVTITYTGAQGGDEYYIKVYKS